MNRVLRMTSNLSVLLTALAVVSCGDDNGGPNEPVTPVATKLGFATQPSNSVAGASIVAPHGDLELASVVVTAVEIQDASGNRLTTATNDVTIALGANPGSGTLSGTTTVAAQNGVATFSDLTIEKAATGYTLVASASGLTAATSNTFVVTAAAAATIEFVAQPVNADARATLAPVEVQLLDAFGNPASGDVTLSFETNPGTMIFHSSGLNDPIVQRIDPLTPAVLPPLPNAHPAGTAEIIGMVYDPSTGLVLCTEFDATGNTLCAMNPLDGTYGQIGQIQPGVGGDFPPYVRPLAWAPDGSPLGAGAHLLAGDLNNPTLYEIDPATGAKGTVGAVTGTVGGFNGMAVDPTTGTLYAVVQQAQIAPPDPARRIRDLVTIDLNTLIATTIGTLPIDGVSSAAFLPDGTLLVSTGEGGATAESLYTVDKTDASMTLLVVMGDGDDGESIALVPAALSGTLTLSTVNGVAAFDDLWIDGPGAGYSLNAASGGLTAISSTFDVATP